MPQPVSADNTGFNSPSANSNVGWDNPQNAYSSDDNRAVADRGSDIVDYYSFNLQVIPSDATINGIEVSVEGYQNGGGYTRQADISLSWNNGSSYTIGAGTGVKTTNMPGNNAAFEAVRTYGGASDTWGRTWATGDSVNTNFRVRLDTILADTVTSVTLTSAGAEPAAVVGTYGIFPRDAVGTGLDSYLISYVDDSLKVNKAFTNWIMSFSANPSTLGRAVTFAATVTGSGATGTVTFKDGDTTLGSSTLSNSTATCTTSTLSVGTHVITAVYEGDTNFVGSTSSAADLTVVEPATGANWGLIGGLIAAAALVNLLLLLKIFRR